MSAYEKYMDIAQQSRFDDRPRRSRVLDYIDPRKWRGSRQILLGLFGTYLLAMWVVSIIAPYHEPPPFPPPPPPPPPIPVTFKNQEKLNELCQGSYYAEHAAPEGIDKYHSIRRLVLNATVVESLDAEAFPLQNYQEDLAEPANEEIIPCEAHEITIPQPVPQANTSGKEIMFGFATDSERFNTIGDIIKPYLSELESPTLFLQEMPEDTSVESSEHLINFNKKLLREGIDATVRYAQEPLSYTERWFHLIKEMYNIAVDTENHRKHTTDWFVILDDDTLLLAPRSFLRMLDRYDPSAPHYIGCPSESSGQRRIWGSMPYGGASVILSRALVRDIVANWDECLAISTKFETGDLKVASCVRYIKRSQPQATSNYFAIESGLHQLDLRGDISGFLQAGLSYITLHHLFGWFNIFPYSDNRAAVELLQNVRRAIGEAGMWQRYRFKGKWLLTNGYSLTEFTNSNSTPSITDLALVEHTFDNDSLDFRSSFGRMRRPLLEGLDKRTYWIKGVYERAKASNGLRRITMVYENQEESTNDIRRIDVEWLAP